jgi:prepilin-type processing-associated H-X9-DG protein
LPRDRPGAIYAEQGLSYDRIRGNYVVCVGTRVWGGNIAAMTGPKGVFGVSSLDTSGNTNTYTPYQTKLVQITDGTSNTLLMSEILVAKTDNTQNGGTNWPSGDFRGDIHHDAYLVTAHIPNAFMTINGPNTSVADNNYCCGTVVVPDPLMPCANGAANARQNAARSRHPGGVNALFADATGRFITNSVALTTWQGLGTMDGGEALGDF